MALLMQSLGFFIASVIIFLPPLTQIKTINIRCMCLCHHYCLMHDSWTLLPLLSRNVWSVHCTMRCLLPKPWERFSHEPERPNPEIHTQYLSFSLSHTHTQTASHTPFVWLFLLASSSHPQNTQTKQKFQGNTVTKFVSVLMV